MRVAVVFLDQNKWIELARAITGSNGQACPQGLVDQVRKAVETNQLVLPLTAANIYETHKVNKPERRHNLAFLQATLSRGMVLRGRQKRLTTEIAAVLAACCNIARPELDDRWFLSKVFLEAFAECDDERLGGRPSERTINFIRQNPSRCLYEYLAGTPEAIRTAAIIRFSDGSERLRALIEDRRARHANETMSVRRRIYSALLMINDLDPILLTANAIGLPWREILDVGDRNARRIIDEVPTYYIEREVALRLEAQSRPIEENDFRDMQTFCAVIPYVDLVVGEKQFVNLARQARLDKTFNVQLETDLIALGKFLDQPGERR